MQANKLILLGTTLMFCLFALSSMAQKSVPERPRILISADIGGTVLDDNQSIAQRNHGRLR